jgi:hypothetical protein
MSTIMSQPIIQYGFAGMCGVQFVFICWLVSRLITAFERNTKAYNSLLSMLSTRPCLYKDRVFMQLRGQDEEG